MNVCPKELNRNLLYGLQWMSRFRGFNHDTQGFKIMAQDRFHHQVYLVVVLFSFTSYPKLFSFTSSSPRYSTKSRWCDPENPPPHQKRPPLLIVCAFGSLRIHRMENMYRLWPRNFLPFSARRCPPCVWWDVRWAVISSPRYFDQYFKMIMLPRSHRNFCHGP